MTRINIDYKKGYLTEGEILLLKNRLNGVNNAKFTTHDIPFPDEGFKLTKEQTEKGYNWLMSQWKTPKGKERKNNPFGYREQAVLEKFKEFRLIDFYDASNYYMTQLGIKAYHPYYWVIAEDGSGFQYTLYGGEIHILG